MEKIIKTLSVRVRDKHAALLKQWAFEVNQIWNNANAETAEWSSVPIPEVGWVYFNHSAYDLAKMQARFAKKRGFSILAQTVQEVTEAHAKARKQFKRNKLRWRSSSGANRSLGWVPFKGGSVVFKNGQVRYKGHCLNVWDSYGLGQYKFRAGSFSEDSKGRWYFNVAVEVLVNQSGGKKSVGIDLGLKDTAITSDGDVLHGRNFRMLEGKLGVAQRANKKKQVKTIHAKIKNRRKDQLHKFSTKLVKNYGAIFVGNVSSKKLVKTKMAKSTLDAGWSSLKTMLEYKSHQAGVVFNEVNEAFSTQICSCCGEIPNSSPKGRTGLGIREWECCECGAVNHRDINAATNILRFGQEALVGGASA